MAEPRKLSPEEFRTMQLLELDMLEELDRVCRKYDIKPELFTEQYLNW